MKSILYVPADRTDLFAKAATGPAEMICLDLEDGVAPDNKAQARKNIPDAVEILREAGKKIAVRVNMDLEHISYDLAALVPGINSIVAPKCGSANVLNNYANALSRLFAAPVNIIALVESAADLHGLSQASALPDQLTALCLGTEDFAADLGVSPNSPLVMAAFHDLSLMAKRFGVAMIGYPGSIAEFRDLALFRQKVLEGKDAGAVGGMAIHPAQVAILQECFTPTDGEIARATEIVTKFEQALAEGHGVVNLAGRMIDKPVYLAAKQMLPSSTDSEHG